VQLGAEEVHGEWTTHYRLKLDVDRVSWPDLGDDFPATRDDMSRRLAIKALPNPRPRGVLPAEVWLDEPGRLRRFSHCPRPDKTGKRAWPTTELWDFGGPPSIEDWKTQPVIDPVTMRFPDSEREKISRLRGSQLR
jgi:hypothetical protein